jgi:hypothetical protein
MQHRIILACLSMLVLAGCDVPKDPESTSDRVRHATFRVGILPGNAEAERQDRVIVALLAEALPAQPAFRAEDAHLLFHALQNGELDLVIGGLPASTPFTDKAGLSREAGPLFRPGESDKRVLAVRQGENAFLMEVNRAIHRHREKGGT